MATISISVSKTKVHTLTFKQFDANNTLVPHGGTSLSSSDNFTATANFDPANDRRVIIHGVNPGTCVVQVGTPPSPLLINVTVTEPPDLSHFELDVDEGES